MYKFLKFLIEVSVLWFVAVLVIFPKECIDSGMASIFLCIDTVIPSLFPFFVCSGIITGMGLTRPLEKIMTPFMKPLFGVSGKGALPFILGLLSGYPVGAVCIADLYSKGGCSKEECEKMLVFCNNSGPLFILGAVGAGMLKNPQLGRWLYIIHILSAIITGLIFRLKKTEIGGMRELSSGGDKDYIKIITEAFTNATSNIISVCGFVIFFCVFSTALSKFGLSPIFHGFLEISGGIEEISELPILFETKLLWISGIIAFSGLSVILQVTKIVKKANLSPKLYLWGKFTQGIISIILTYFMIKFIPITQTTIGLDGVNKIDSIREYAVWISIFIIVFLFYLDKKAVDN